MISNDWKDAGWPDDVMLHGAEDAEDHIRRVITDFITEFDFSPYPTGR